MFSEEIDLASKRTAELMKCFIKNYLKSYVKMSLSAQVQNVVADTLADLKDVAVAAIKGDKAEDKADDTEKSNKIVGVMIADRSRAYDVDSSEFIAYDIVTCVIDPSDSHMQGFRTRYRTLFKLNKDLMQELKDQYPQEKKFPPKKMFGNKDSTFLDHRQHDLNEWFMNLAKHEIVANSKSFLTALKLMDDPDADFNLSVYADAYNTTCAEMNVWIRGDPEDFEDESTGLIMLMLDVSDREIMPRIDERIAKLPTGRYVARKAARSALSKAIGLGVRSAWEAAADPVSKARSALQDVLKNNADKVTDMLKQVIGKVVPAIIEKLPRPKMDPAPEEPKEFAPTIDQVPLGAEMLNALRTEKSVTPALTNLAENLQSKITLTANVDDAFSKVIDEIPDIDLRWTLNRLKDLVIGLIEYWTKVNQCILQGLVPFFHAREVLEDKLVEIGSKEGNSEAAKTASEHELKQVNAKLIDDIREFGLKMCAITTREQRELRWKLRVLSPITSAQLRDNLMVVPTDLLNFIGAYHVGLFKALEGVYAKGTDADTVRAEVRRIFVDSGLDLFNGFFGTSWLNMTHAVHDAARQTLKEKFAEPVKPIVEGILNELQSVIQMPGGMDLSQVTDIAVDKLLDALANAALKFCQKKLEAAIFKQ